MLPQPGVLPGPELVYARAVRRCLLGAVGRPCRTYRRGGAQHPLHALAARKYCFTVQSATK